MKKMKITMIAAAVVLALGLGAVAGGYFWYRENHVKVNGTVYNIHTETVDLRGTPTTAAQYEALHSALPGAEILWDVPFQGGVYGNHTREITVETLTPEDIQQLQYLPELSLVHAGNCRDYEALTELARSRPDCQVEFSLHIGQQALDTDVQTLALGPGEGTDEELRDVLQYATGMTQVSLEDPSISAQTLYELQDQYPNVQFTWNKAYNGTVYPMDTTFLDLSDTSPESLEQVESFAAYFPDLTQLDMLECGFSNEEMAQFRDRVRDRYKVVWAVQVGAAYLRTDVTGFTPGNRNQRVRNDDTYDLRYCEDLIAVDFGHIGISNLEWVVGTPHLKYLIVGDGNVFNEDIKPLSQLKELEWLEIFNSPVTDVSPLVGCTGLKDLLLSGSYIDVEPLGKMPWLDNIWLLRSGIDGRDITYLHEHLPNTHLEVADTPHAHSHGWRLLPRYYDMRDALDMPYIGG